MARTRHFKTVYKNELIKIAGSMPSYIITWPDGKSILIEHFADGWYKPGSPDEYWTADDITELGLLIQQKTKQV